MKRVIIRLVTASILVGESPESKIIKMTDEPLILLALCKVALPQVHRVATIVVLKTTRLSKHRTTFYVPTENLIILHRLQSANCTHLRTTKTPASSIAV